MSDIKSRKSIIKKMMKGEKGEIKELNLSEHQHPDWSDRGYANNHYTITVQSQAPMIVGSTVSYAIKALVQRHDNKPLEKHRSELQYIKNEIWGKDAIGVEYYPDEHELINDQNVYWLWIVNQDIFPIPDRYNKLNSIIKRVINGKKSELKELNLSKYEDLDWAEKAYANNHCSVVTQSKLAMKGGSSVSHMTKAIIKRHDNKPFTKHWAELQSIKNELWGDNAVAVEYYFDEDDNNNSYKLCIIDKKTFPIPVRDTIKRPYT